MVRLKPVRKAAPGDTETDDVAKESFGAEDVTGTIQLQDSVASTRLHVSLNRLFIKINTHLVYHIVVLTGLLNGAANIKEKAQGHQFLPTGPVGKLQMMKSGRVYLVTDLDIEHGQRKIYEVICEDEL